MYPYGYMKYLEMVQSEFSDCLQKIIFVLVFKGFGVDWFYFFFASPNIFYYLLE